VLSGVFEKYPKLKIILGHFGETIPFLLWRIDTSLKRPGQKQLNFRDIFSSNFYLTTSGFFSNPALLCCVMEMGVDHILFAIDWPFVMNPPGVEWMKDIPLCDEDKAKILSGNAQRLLRM
jgi:2,3-dihydroxybenzoate decarboxylase